MRRLRLDADWLVVMCPVLDKAVASDVFSHFRVAVDSFPWLTGAQCKLDVQDHLHDGPAFVLVAVLPLSKRRPVQQAIVRDQMSAAADKVRARWLSWPVPVEHLMTTVSSDGAVVGLFMFFRC